MLGSLDQRSMSHRSIVLKPFPINNSITHWPTLLKLGPHIHPAYQRNPNNVWVNGSKVKVNNFKYIPTMSHLGDLMFYKHNLFLYTLSLYTFWPNSRLYNQTKCKSNVNIMYIDIGLSACAKTINRQIYTGIYIV